MAKLTMSQKERGLNFCTHSKNITQKEAAERVGVSAVTMNKWVRVGKWDELKVSITITREEQLKSLYRQLTEMNRTIAGRESAEGNRYPTSAEADTISKLANAIDKLETETGLNEVLSSFKEFLGWLRKFDIATAQKLVPLFDDFVKTKLR